MLECAPGATNPDPNHAQAYRVKVSKFQRWVMVVGVVLLALAGILAVLFDWREVRGAVAQANWMPVLAGLGVAAGSYVVQGYSFALVNRSFGVQLGLRPLYL